LKEITLEFGVLIAYAIPGVFALFGVATFVPDIGALLSQRQTEQWLSTAVLVAGLSVTLGMFVSVLRASTIDASFLVRVPILAQRIGPHWGKLARVDPSYARLASKDVLAAFQEAKANDKRPYQFYGNMLVALVILETSRFQHVTIGELGLALSMILGFYFAARKSYYRYVTAVAELNVRGGG
jgi:hypothetical protein